MTKRKRANLYIIDGNHLVHRAFYAIRTPLKTSLGEPTNALYGFMSMLLNILDSDQVDYLIVAFDEHGPTFRHEIHKEYKGTRSKAPDELYIQIPYIKEMLKSAGLVMVSKKGYEADDAMGTLAKKAKSENVTTYLVTGDMDLLQLVDDSTFVVFPHKGYKSPIVYDEKAVLEKYEIYPHQVVDFKGLVGDSSDNIKGVAGIGPKGACRLLSKYKTLDAVYENIDHIKGSIQSKLLANQDSAFFSRTLATIMTDAPFDLDLEASSIDRFNWPGLLLFLEKMEMKSLITRIKKIIPADLLVDKNQMNLF